MYSTRIWSPSVLFPLNGEPFNALYSCGHKTVVPWNVQETYFSLMAKQVRLGRHHFSSPFWRVNKVLLLLYSSSDSVKSESVKSGKRFTLSSFKGERRENRLQTETLGKLRRRKYLFDSVAIDAGNSQHSWASVRSSNPQPKPTANGKKLIKFYEHPWSRAIAAASGSSIEHSWSFYTAC